ncbi:MAG: HAMP domain-containing sensor histidine kinase [Bacilli bacterium]
MLKSKEFKSLSKKFLVLVGALAFILVGCIIISKQFMQDYVYQQIAKEIGNIVATYPEAESEIIATLKRTDISSKEGISLLEKYGITSSNIMELSNNTNSTIIIFFTSIFIIILGAVTILYLLHLKTIYRKLDKINEYINSILNNEYFLNLKEYEEGAFSTLKNDIYKITTKLREQHELLETDKKYLETTLSDISHQLKTPLTSMYMINNLLEDDKLNKKMKHDFLYKNRLQLERVEWLVSSLLKLSKLESGTIKFKPTEVTVDDLIIKALEPLNIAIELKEQQLFIKGDKDITVCCDVNWTVEAIVNIIKNAYEHTETLGIISISWEDNPIYTDLFIKDNGNGIDPSDINHIFERFYKGSHNSKESIGIGLNMTKQILTRQGFSINVESSLGQGTMFTIRFYKNKTKISYS